MNDEPALRLRLATAADVAPLAALYADVVRRLAPALYLPEQVQAWASSVDDRARFSEFVLAPRTLVAEWAGVLHPVGFCGLEVSGRIASLYVHADFGRRGIATTLLTEQLAHAATAGLTRLRTEASKFSRPVFERFGFQVDEIERGEHKGVPFMRYRMSREMLATGNR